MKKWNLNSWTKLEAKHLPVYEDKAELDLVLSKVKKISSFSFCRRNKIVKKIFSRSSRR